LSKDGDALGGCNRASLKIHSAGGQDHCGIVVAHIRTKYYVAADMTRDREINLSYLPTVKMLADNFTGCCQCLP